MGFVGGEAYETRDAAVKEGTSMPGAPPPVAFRMVRPQRDHDTQEAPSAGPHVGPRGTKTNEA